MNTSILVAMMILVVPPAHADQYPCQNPKGRTDVSGILHAKKSPGFDGTTIVSVGIPRTLEGRGYFYSLFVIGDPEKSYISVAPQVNDWTATAHIKHTSLPVYFEARYGLNTRCQTRTRIKIQ